MKETQPGIFKLLFTVNFGNGIEKTGFLLYDETILKHKNGDDFMNEKKPNILMGILGALLGALIGGAVIILLNRLGVVSAASGALLSVCVIFGYMKLGNGFGFPGVLISLALIAVTPYLADRLDWALLIKEAYNEYSLMEAFRAVPDFIEFGAIDSGVYAESLGRIYIFAAIGAVPTLINIFKK